MSITEFEKSVQTMDVNVGLYVRLFKPHADSEIQVKLFVSYLNYYLHN